MSLHDLHRPLGDTGLIVSPLGLGTVKLGRDQGVKYPNGFTIPDDAAARALLDQARALGINLIDTAPAYGVSEQRLGPLLRGQRAHQDEGALQHIIQGQCPLPAHVQPQVAQGMNGGIEKRKQADQAAHACQGGQAQRLAQRCDGQGQAQAAQGPVAGAAQQSFGGVGP